MRRTFVVAALAAAGVAGISVAHAQSTFSLFSPPGGQASPPFTGVHVFGSTADASASGVWIDGTTLVNTTSAQTIAGTKTFSGNPVFSGIPVFSGLASGSCANGLALDSSNNLITTSCGGGGGGSLTLTDGTHTVVSTTQITVTGGTVGGTTPNATLTITGASGVTSIAPANAGVTLSPNPIVSTGTIALNITGGGAVSHQWISAMTTAGVATLSQPAFTDISGSASAAQMSTNLGAAVSTLCSASTTNFVRGDGTCVAPGGGGGLSGMTAGQVPIAATASTVTSSKALTGNGTSIASSTGALTNGHCVSIDASGNFVDAGGACTTGGGGGTVNAGTAGQVSYYATSTNAVSGSSGLTLSGTKLTAASIGLGSDATGDIYYNGGSGTLTRLGIGSAGNVLTVSGGLPAWAAPSGGGNMTGSGTTAANDILASNNTGATLTSAVSASTGKFVWSATKGPQVNLNTTATFPTTQVNGMQIVGLDSANAGISVHSFTGANVLSMSRSDGTNATPSALQSGDLISALTWRGYKATALSGSQAEMDVKVPSGQTWTDSSTPTQISLFTTNTGTTTLVERMRLDMDGSVEIANSSGTLPGAAGPGTIAVPTTGGYYIGTIQAGSQIADANTTLTSAQWVAFVQVTVSTAGHTFTMPAASGLSTNGGFHLCTRPGITTTVARNGTPGTDTLNGNNVASVAVGGGQCLDITSNGTTDFEVPYNQKVVSISWGPGQDLATQPISIFTADVARIITGISCRVDTAEGGSATIDVRTAASGTALGSGTDQTSTPCNANGTANTNQTGLLTGAGTMAAGTSVGIVGTGFGTTNGSGSLSVYYQ